MRRTRLVFLPLIVLSGLLVPIVVLAPVSTADHIGATVRASVYGAFAQANGLSEDPEISDDGRWTTFTSRATNLVGADTDTVRDVYLRDRVGTTDLVSQGTNGKGNATSDSPTVAGSGRHVAFRSFASNLVPGDTNNVADIYVRTMPPSTVATTRLSRGYLGDEPNGASSEPSISQNGRFVAFTSLASNLVPDDTNGVADVFVVDRDFPVNNVMDDSPLVTVRVSVGSAGEEGDGASGQPSISASGRFVAFTSQATAFTSDDPNFASDVFLRNRNVNNDATFDAAGDVSTLFVSARHLSSDHTNAASDSPSVNDNGTLVAFRSDSSELVSGDTNGWSDVFVRDVSTSRTELLSSSSSGVIGNSRSDAPAIAPDGSYVAFRSWASNLVAGDTNGARDVFLRKPSPLSVVTRFSVSDTETQATGRSDTPSVSWKGEWLAFTSTAANLVSGDTNNASDVFVRQYDHTAPTLPSNPTWDAHLTSTWYSDDNTPTMSWAAPTDAGMVGVRGYSVLWDKSPTTDPDSTVETSATTYTPVVALGEHQGWYFHIRPVDFEGQFGPARHAGPYWIDKTGPVASMTTVPRFVGSTTVPLAYTATDLSGVASYTVGWRAQNTSGVWSPLTTLGTAAATSRQHVITTPTSTYCYFVRATDTRGNLGAWSAPKCSNAPINGNVLTSGSRSGWTRHAATTSWYGSDYHRSHTLYSELYTPSYTWTKSLGLLVYTCPTCGKIELSTPNQAKEISLVSAQATYRKISTFELFSAYSGPLKIRATGASSSKPVYVDGFFVSRCTLDHCRITATG